MGMSKSKVGAATAGPSKQYMAKGGKVGKKMMGGANAAMKPAMKKGGMYKLGGKKGK
jgi:hypothetical protein